MDQREELPRELDRSALPWAVAPAWQPFWYVYLAFSWWQAGVGEATRAGTASAASAAALVPAGKLAGFLSEAAFHCLWWRGRGRRLPYWRFFCVVASISLTDVLAIRLGDLARVGSPVLAAWLAAVAGLHLWRGSVFALPALPLAFGSLGLLTVARIAVTAQAQSRAIGVRPAIALGWTLLVWLLSRIALWWLVDLARGRSPLPLR